MTETVETVTVSAGVELDIPVCNSWRIKPYAEAGFGKRISGDEEAFLYRAGVKGVRLWPRERTKIRLGSALKFEGFELLESDLRDSYGVGEIGAEVRWPAGFELRENAANFGAYLIARRFLPGVELDPRGLDPVAVSDQLEVGLTFGTKPSLTIWGLDAPRIGLAYRWGDGLSSYRLNFGFPF